MWRPKTFLPCVLAVATVLVSSCAAEDAERPDGNPTTGSSSTAPTNSLPARRSGMDVLLITIDTLRADALGSYGDSRAATPWMDRLAREGVRFDNARAHNTNTLPSHATIFSGLYPYEHGVRDNSGFRFPEGIETLATVLRARGYRTGAFISAFPLDAQFGLHHGFEVYDDGFLDASTGVAFQVQERPGTETVARAMAWLDSDDGRPSFTWVHLFEPHFPYAPHGALAETFRDDPYRGDVAAADAALAPLIERRLESGQREPGLIVLTSDHGEALGDHGEPTHGIFAYDSVLKVPLIVHAPPLLPAAAVAEPARLVDLMPTILDLLDIEPPPGLTGRSLLPLIARGNSRSDARHTARATYFESLSPRFNLGWAPLRGIVANGWKYIDLPIPELYDLTQDPAEAVNLATREGERLRELQAQLRQLTLADAGSGPVAETEATRRRLEALGYLGGGGSSERQEFDEDDDPKRLIHLFRDLRDVGGLYSTGRLEEARSLCRRIISQRPGMRVALMYLAQIERDLGNLDGAVRAMRQVYELKTNDVEALALLASYLTQADNPLEAVQVTDEHARLEVPDAEVMLTRGLALARLRRRADALATLEKARTLDPANPQIPVYIGTVHLIGGDRRSARAAYEEALRIDPDTVHAHSSLAIMASEENRTSEAVEHWRQALTLDSRQHATLFRFAAGMWQSGNVDQARPLLELFLASAPPASFRTEIGRARQLLGTP